MDYSDEPLDDQPLSADDAQLDAELGALWFDLGYFDGEADDDNV